MTTRSNFFRRPLALGLALVLLPLAAAAQGGKIRMPDFSGLAEKAEESVDISLEGEQLKNIGYLLSGNRNQASDAQLAELVKDLQAIYVKVFEFRKPGEYSMRDIEQVIRQVERDGWKKVLSVREEDERVELWMRDGGDQGGMFFVASEPDELVMINIVGNVNLAALGQLQGRLGISGLPGMAGPPGPAPAPRAAPAPNAPPAPPAAPRSRTQ
jgi:hypothetical protein